MTNYNTDEQIAEVADAIVPKPADHLNRATTAAHQYLMGLTGNSLSRVVLKAAVKAALEVDGWQPIETASKDTKSRLVWCPAYRNTYVVGWVIPLDEFAKPAPDEGFWAHFGGSSRPLSEVPTHWQPLPEPPQ